MSAHRPTPPEIALPADTHVAVVAARFNPHIVEGLLAGCVQRLGDYGLRDGQIAVHRVPGAFELPVAASWLARSERYNAVICLGCVIRGETAHFEYVAGEAARGIQAVAVATGVPVIFGVLTTETEQQARDRTGGAHGHAGISAADAAAEMIALRARISSAG
jgi:6,7-dimethyl-8-ribityllumazine synthase